MEQTRTADVRRWAKEHGLEVAARGRLAPHVLLAYEEAQSAALDVPRPAVRTVSAKPTWDWARR